MKDLQRKWERGGHWPKFLNWIEVQNIRGWAGQRISFDFPIVALVGENGSGKSTVLQAAACAYRNSVGGTFFPTEFFPETTWDLFQNASVRSGYKQGPHYHDHTIRKPTRRWLGQPERPMRPVRYLDLSRLQPISTRVGYARIAKNRHAEASAQAFTGEQVARMSDVMGRVYREAKMAVTNLDASREVPVLTKANDPYSGFHQGSGETTVAELLRTDFPKHGLIIIDEIESSLHPRAQRRLIRDLATVARREECQIIISTHSPYVLEELPLKARIYLFESDGSKRVANGVSPQFAMTKMDDEEHTEYDVYVEDVRAKVFVGEILSKFLPELFPVCSIVPYGAASVGTSLGQMVDSGRFDRPSVVFLDGDQDPAPGCFVLPGQTNPERVVFETLRGVGWGDLWAKVSRDVGRVANACETAMANQDHHNWIAEAANDLRLSGDALWQAMCGEYVSLKEPAEFQEVIDAVEAVTSLE